MVGGFENDGLEGYHSLLQPFKSKRDKKEEEEEEVFTTSQQPSKARSIIAGISDNHRPQVISFCSPSTHLPNHPIQSP
jgi:hypothetical protein